MVLLARRLPCSLLPPLGGPCQQRANHRARVQQLRQRAQRRCVGRRPDIRAVQVGPRRRDQRLAAIRQHHQQLQLPLPASLPQHRQLLAPHGMTRPGDPHRAHRVAPPAPRRPLLCSTASTTRSTLTLSKVDRQSPRSTGTPAAILAAIRSTQPSLPEHGNPPPANALTAAGQSTTASTRSPAIARPTQTNRPTNSSRHSQRSWPISSSTAASA